MAKHKTIFVTVGTTLFEALVEAVLTEGALQWMVDNKYTHLIVQYGKGHKPVLLTNCTDLLEIELYDFKPSLNEDMQKADLILCHAGAGTLMEALPMPRKKIATVINTALMDNHQAELAHALARLKLLWVVDDLSVAALPWNDIEHFQPVPYTGGDEHDVPRMLDSFFGFDKSE